MTPSYSIDCDLEHSVNYRSAVEGKLILWQTGNVDSFKKLQQRHTILIQNYNI